MATVIFDLDGTLIYGQSQFYLIGYLRRKKIISLFSYVLIFIWFIGYKLHLLNDPKVAVDYAFKLFAGKSEADLDLILRDFFSKVLKEKFNKEILEILKNHQQKGARIILVTNCIEGLAKIVVEFLDIKEFAATKMEKGKNGLFTGRLERLVYDKEKVRVLKEEFRFKSGSGIIVYADHYSDGALFDFATEAFLVNPSNKTWDFLKNKYNLGVLNKNKKTEMGNLIFKLK